MKVNNTARAQYDRIADDDLQYYREVLSALAQEYLFTPVSDVSRPEDSDSIEELRVPLVFFGDQHYISAFTSEDLFHTWSDGTYRCCAVLGIHLANSLPEGIGLVINPNTNLVFEYPPELIKELLGPNMSKAEEGECKGTDAEDKTDDLPAGQERTPLKIIPEETVDGRMLTHGRRLKQDLTRIVKKYHSVVEAYYVRSKTTFTVGVLGMRTDGLSAEERFCLTAEVASVSRVYYGVAGAIEVYDDLHTGTSRSKELFNSLTPFYVRGADCSPEAPSEGEEREVEGVGVSTVSWRCGGE